MGKAKITEVPVVEEHEYIFKCKKCGNTFASIVPLTTGKFSGGGVRYCTMTVCKNCMLGNEYEF